MRGEGRGCDFTGPTAVAGGRQRRWGGGLLSEARARHKPAGLLGAARRAALRRGVKTEGADKPFGIDERGKDARGNKTWPAPLKLHPTSTR